MYLSRTLGVDLREAASWGSDTLRERQRRVWQPRERRRERSAGRCLARPPCRRRRRSTTARDPRPELFCCGRSLIASDQDLREGSASEALLFDEVELQVLVQLGERAVARADRDRDRRQLVFVDEAQAGQRLGEVGTAV